jgi:hypothetical protein
VDWIKGVQEVVPWLTTLPLLPKAIISGLIVGAAAFVLALIWTPPPEGAVKAILADCYRRALFTRMHAQLDVDAMFASIGECREVLQKKIPDIHRKGLQDTAVELLATVEQIERRNPIRGSDDVLAHLIHGTIRPRAYSDNVMNLGARKPGWADRVSDHICGA